MKWAPAGWPEATSLTLAKQPAPGPRQLNGAVKRPSPPPPAPCFTNQIGVETLIVTCALPEGKPVGNPVPRVFFVTVYQKVSAPEKPAAGLYLNDPSAFIVTCPLFKVTTVCEPSGTVLLAPDRFAPKPVSVSPAPPAVSFSNTVLPDPAAIVEVSILTLPIAAYVSGATVN